MNHLKPALRARKAAEVTQNCDHLISVGISRAPSDQSALNSPVRVTIMANSPQRYAPPPAVYLEVDSRNPHDLTTCSDIDMMSSNADGRFVHKDGAPYPSS
jgi:hypothetical protein